MQVSIDLGRTYVDIDAIYIRHECVGENEELVTLQTKSTYEGFITDIIQDGAVLATSSITAQEKVESLISLYSNPNFNGA
jgi:hypothetical protein